MNYESLNKDELRVKVAEILFKAFIEKGGLVPHQRTDSQLLYGGCDSKGLWIYIRPDGSFYGENYDSKEALVRGELKHFHDRHNWPEDLNDAAEMEKALNANARLRNDYGLILGDLCANDHSESKYGREIWKATARQRCLAFLKVMG